MPRLANVSEGQISEDECSALRSFHAFSLVWLSMESCNRNLCTHTEGPLFREKHHRTWKIVEITLFSTENTWCTVIIVSLQTTWMSTATQETSKMVPQRDLTYLYENFCRRRMSLSYWHKGGQKQTWCTHTKYTYAPFNVHTEISLRSLATNTNTALNVSTSKQPKWVFLKHCQSVKYGQYFRLLYVPLTLTY